MPGDAYKRAGVDIDAADRMIDRLKPLAAATHRSGVMGGLGGFGGLFHLQGRFKDPVLVSGTDGVGTKLLVAQQAGVHDTIGIDLVAMCVNDIIVLGAEPLFFLDYFATGQLDPAIGEAVVSGIAEGCKRSGCALLGGETAEMPGLYSPGHYDLAGFAVGAVERDKLKDGSQVQAGDVLIGLPSSGLHSNGFSLVRKVLLEDSGHSLTDVPDGWSQSLGDVLLTPTRIYVEELLRLGKEVDFHAAAHITGGGLPGNIVRVLSDSVRAVVDLGSWQPPAVFQLLQELGGLTSQDMHSTFNCGLGMVVVVAAEDECDTIRLTGGFRVGQLESGKPEVILE
jgi:phosphoribosylformylglycinamidine cyclo-ligase